ncbi:beta-lactamase family protein [Arthrobacter sp. zg-Y916]|uniref:serine hydrolase domain-containing protein n=1 Tax=Arthrobacter sp. zg-Y916 TaxID=2894190 RepID=UPI001E29B214|nr:serine hydrolase domain-containing protein [Arthrobacter sp. zg-Y916]MCC9193164.1 beta-lactamase family protein [Arthrobacter sp. zg-Y916]
MPGLTDGLWDSLEARVSSGWCPGLVAGVRIGGEVEVHAAGTYALDDVRPMNPATPFRISSLSKLVGGALALSLVADGTLDLDDDVSRWLPDLAELRVLATPDAPLAVTGPARGPMTLRHLLTMTAGFGIDFGPTPYAAATRDLLWGPTPPALAPDEYMARLGSLPLAAQPGDRWMYHAGADVLSALLPKVAGIPLRDLLAERITGPLGLAGTDFPTGQEEFPAAYEATAGGLLEAAAYQDAFASPPVFESLAGGLVSTVPDFVAFLAALADDVLLPAGLGAQMTSDQLTDAQRPGFAELAGPEESWGFMSAVQTGPGASWSEPGMWGWAGGSGTSAAVYPNGDIGVVFTQRFMAGPDENFDWFWAPFGQARSQAAFG